MPDNLTRRLEAAIDADPARPHLAGAIRISRGGELLYERAYGQASVQLGVPNTLATRFHIASATKMFISAAIMRLVDDGHLALGQHPGDLAPELASLDRRTTLHHLLSHTAGVADIYDAPDLRVEMAKLSASSGRLLDYLAASPSAFPPGERWRYSSSGYLMLAYVAERAAGAPFADLLRSLVLDPLGLNDTGPDNPFLVNPGRASGHVGRDGVWRNAPNDRLAEIEGPRELYSTVADLDRWGAAILAGTALSAAAAALTFTPHAAVDQDSGFGTGLSYGYGWFLGPDYRFIGGMTEGFRATMWQFPAEELNVVMLWNNEPIDSGRLLRALRPLLSEAAG
ncbi:MAG TPA: serine hydrolase domain-containing protein [Caulobacteraceae bacterium]|nr:serine hydrolase domain-containing protein [Caulobacteraceae bacterium]